MTEQASLRLTAGQSGLDAIPTLSRSSLSRPSLSRPASPSSAQTRKVAGKSQLVVSAVGMAMALLLLCHGAYLAAGLMFLLTLGVLELMFQRALAQYHASCGHPYRRPGRSPHLSPQPGLSGD
jgi:hypothetical protein